jgi:HlyD family secretion protein
MIVVGGIVVIGLGVPLIRASRATYLRTDLDRLQVEEVFAGRFQEYLTALGEVVPIRTVYLDAIEGGRVEEVLIKEGDRVEAGDPLVKLTNTNLLLDVMYREAELFQQSNNLRNTRLAMEQFRLRVDRELLEIDFELRERERQRAAAEHLGAAGLIPSHDVEAARDEYDLAHQLRAMVTEQSDKEEAFRLSQAAQLQGSLERMQANLEVARRNIDQLVMRAPVTGYLTSLAAEVGQSKVRGERLGKIDVLDSFKVRARVDEHYLPRLQRGQRAVAELADTEYELVVDRVSLEVRNGDCETDLLFTADRPPGIRRGQSLHLRLFLGTEAETIMIPRGPFFHSTGGQWVFKISEDGTSAERHDIQLGMANPHHFQVVDGLQPGERVIVSSYEPFGNADRLVFR